MNQTQFSLTETPEGTIQVAINGTGKDLIDLLVSAISSNDKIKELIETSLMMAEFQNQFKAQLN
jgi:hypothetical protein